MYSLLRNIKNTTYYYIRNVALKDFVYTERFLMESGEHEGVYEIPRQNLNMPHPSDRGRGFCPFTLASGIFGQCVEADNITLYDSLNPINPTEYTVNYENAFVTVSGSTVPAAIDSPWYYVATSQKWPKGDIPPRPLVILSLKKYSAQGFQLGGGKQPVLDAVIDIFGSTQTELDNISEKIFNSLYLKSSPIYNFEDGDVYNYDGTYNNNFTCGTLINPAVLYFERVSIKYIELNAYDADDLDMYRSQIVFVGTAYIEA